MKKMIVVIMVLCATVVFSQSFGLNLAPIGSQNEQPLMGYWAGGIYYTVLGNNWAYVPDKNGLSTFEGKRYTLVDLQKR